MSELATRISRVTDKELYHSLLYAIIDNKYAYLSDGAEQNRIAANPNDSVILSNNNVHKFFTKNEQFINDLVKLLPKIQE